MTSTSLFDMTTKTATYIPRTISATTLAKYSSKRTPIPMGCVPSTFTTLRHRWRQRFN